MDAEKEECLAAIVAAWYDKEEVPISSNPILITERLRRTYALRWAVARAKVVGIGRELDVLLAVLDG